MNWEAIGALGDAVSGVGVVLSLVYLAIQTRNNTSAIRSATFHEVNSSFAEISLALAMDAEMTDLVQKALSGEGELSSSERARFGFFALTFFRRAESVFFQSEQGTLQQESWRGLEGTLRGLARSAAGRQWWSEFHDRFNPRFQVFVRERLLDPPDA